MTSERTGSHLTESHETLHSNFGNIRAYPGTDGSNDVGEAWEAMTVGINTTVPARTGSGGPAGSLMSGFLHR
jgi:hypothetical protein